jgi:ribosomal subunit interface protein
MSTQITFRDFPPSDAVREHVERRASKILARAERVVSLRVTLSAPHRHQHHGGAYRVAIDLALPGHEIVISPRDGTPGHTDLHAAVDDAFDDADRRLRDFHARRDSVKSHAPE